MFIGPSHGAGQFLCMSEDVSRAVGGSHRCESVLHMCRPCAQSTEGLRRQQACGGRRNSGACCLLCAQVQQISAAGCSARAGASLFSPYKLLYHTGPVTTAKKQMRSENPWSSSVMQTCLCLADRLPDVHVSITLNIYNHLGSAFQMRPGLPGMPEALPCPGGLQQLMRNTPQSAVGSQGCSPIS